MSCSNCGGYNPDSCIMCRRGKLRLVVLTAPLLILLAACDPPSPAPAPTTWVQLADSWGFGIFLVTISLVWALGDRWKRPNHCKGCRCAQEEEEGL